MKENYGSLRALSLMTMLALALISTDAMARNTPCSGKKGGVSHCSGGKFICNDGSMSASKKTCGRN